MYDGSSIGGAARRMPQQQVASYLEARLTEQARHPAMQMKPIM